VPAQLFSFGISINFTLEFWMYVTTWHTYDQFIGQWGTYSTFQFSNISSVIGMSARTYGGGNFKC
jgi:hypothetical protein